jgi:Uma2 family endonuclease
MIDTGSIAPRLSFALKRGRPPTILPIMPDALDIPSIKDAAAFHLRRWEQLCADPYVQRLEGRVETNRFGEIVMMPPPGFTHSNHQSGICLLLKELMPEGRSLTECAVLTSDGVKGVDVAWISERRIKQGLKGEVLTVAPEVCVEVISPGNTRQEMEAKRALYFEAGAEEVWFCDRHGTLHFFRKCRENSATKASALCPAMPGRVKP